MAALPPDFGGLVTMWIPDVGALPELFGGRSGPRAAVLRYGEGRIIEKLTLTPLNVLQLHKTLGELIAEGERRGFITEEHRAQAILLPTVEGLDEIPERKYVDEITGEE